MIAICIGTVGVVLYTFSWAWTVDSVGHAKEVNSIQDLRRGNESVTFAIYLNRDKYKEILETVDYPLYACQ